MVHEGESRTLPLFQTDYKDFRRVKLPNGGTIVSELRITIRQSTKEAYTLRQGRFNERYIFAPFNTEIVFLLPVPHS